jgi:hypothetical protein
MNKLFENFQNNASPNQLNKTNIYQPKIYISTDSFIENENNINNYNDFSLNRNTSMHNESSNYIYLTYNENISQQNQNQRTQSKNDNIKIKNDKIKINKKASFDSSKENKNNKNIKNQEEINKKEANKNRIIIGPCSEVKNFKTELCHSWELTGTCKYGQNVIILLY